MSLGAAKAATFGASNQAGDVAVSPLPVGLAIMSAADTTKNNSPGYGIARGSNGDLYVPSYFYDGVDASTNVAITKYDGTTMAVLWSKHIQSAGATAACSVRDCLAVSDGVIVSSNHYTGTKNIVAITKLAFDGTVVWAKHISATASVAAPFVAEASNGDIVVAAQGAVGLLVARLTSAGAEVWKKDYTTVVTIGGIAVDASDNINIGGHVSDVVQYVGLVKLNSAGVLQANPRWNLATVYRSDCYSLSLDSGGNVYLAGRLTNSATAADSDGFLMKLNSSLVLQWTRKIKAAPTDQYDWMQAEVGPDDMIYVIGYTKDADTVVDGFLAKYDTAGVLQWKRSLVTGRSIWANVPAILVDDTNVTVLVKALDTSSVYDTWAFTVPIDGTGTGTYNDMVYADATNVTDSAYAGVTAYGNFGLTEVASSAVIGAGDETLLESGLTSDWFPEAGSKAYRAYRLVIHTIVDDAQLYASVGELQLMVGATAHPTVDMTSNILPSPLVASADNELVSYPAYRAFDGLTAGVDRWAGTHTAGEPHWLAIDLGVGNAIQLTGYKVTSSDIAVRTPASWTLYGSDTGAFAGEEEGIHSESGHTWTNWEEKTFTF